MPSTENQPIPTSGVQRFISLDVLRGVAALMIFVVNIKMMANGYNHYSDRSLWPGEAAQLIGYLHNLLVHGKFVTIFTALFGAGLALLLARETPVPLAVVFKRLFWLAVFGALHLVFIREGDILLSYALVGFVAVPFVRMKGTVLLALGIGIHVGLLIDGIVAPVTYEDVPVLWRTTPNMHLDVKAIMLGSLRDQVLARLDAVYYSIIDLFIRGRGWLDKLGVMLIGMGLLKTRFLTGELSLKTYLRLGIAGLSSASLLVWFRVLGGAELPWAGTALSVLWVLHRFGGALAWSALVVGAVSAGWRGKAVAAVGRTAFSVYILQSVIGLLLFSSLGLGLFGQLSLATLTLITAGVFAFFLIAAPLWLSRFRFGPLEWLWRSLTYGRRQELLRSRGAAS